MKQCNRDLYSKRHEKKDFRGAKAGVDVKKY